MKPEETTPEFSGNSIRESDERLAARALPVVNGRKCEWSIDELERRCLVFIQCEQERLCPNNALIAVLCNAVRLGREHVDYWASFPTAQVQDTVNESDETCSHCNQSVDDHRVIDNKPVCPVTTKTKAGGYPKETL